MVPDPVIVAHDVNQAIFDTLTPYPVPPESYDLGMTPREDWSATPAAWTEHLQAVFLAVQQKYPVLPLRPTQQDVSATLVLPLATTHQLIVGRIFSPSLRHRLKQRILTDRRSALAPAR
jgi:hypothetical protein